MCPHSRLFQWAFLLCSRSFFQPVALSSKLKVSEDSFTPSSCAEAVYPESFGGVSCSTQNAMLVNVVYSTYCYVAYSTYCYVAYSTYCYVAYSTYCYVAYSTYCYVAYSTYCYVAYSTYCYVAYSTYCYVAYSTYCYVAYSTYCYVAYSTYCTPHTYTIVMYTCTVHTVMWCTVYL